MLVSDKEQAEILGVLEKMICEQSLIGGEGVSHVATWWRSVSVKGTAV